MSTSNPYAPPKAAVADVIDDSVGVQPVRTWSSQGRIGRLRYLAYLSAAYLAVMLLAVVLGAVLGASRMPRAASVVGALCGAAYLVFAVLKSIQRSHDMDWSGWSALLALIPFVGLLWIFKAGTHGGNRFGAPPPANTLGVKILGLLFPFLVTVGVLAAIALPAYNQYVLRAKAAQMK